MVVRNTKNGFRIRLAAVVWVLLALVGTAIGQDLSILAEEPAADSLAAKSISVGADAIQDQKIEKRLEEIFASLDGLDEVQAEVKNGVVTLTGIVAVRSLAEQADQLAGRVKGVVTVNNQLDVNRTLSSRLVIAQDGIVDMLINFVQLLPGIVVALIMVAIFWLLARLVASWDFLFERLAPNAFIGDLVRQIVKAAIIITGLILALQILDASALLGSIAGALGLVGLAVGFATRDTVENYIASILLSLRHPFEPRDHVKINTHEGRVIRLSSRATILMSLDGNHIRIPNADVYKSVITNYTRNPLRRFEFSVGVDTSIDLDEPRRIAQECLSAMPGVLKDPAPSCIVDKLGDSSVVLLVLGWVDQREADFIKVRSEALRAVKDAYDAAGIVMPEPIYNVNLRRRKSHSPNGRPTDDAGAKTISAAEIAPDQTISEQIALEASTSDKENLLDPDAASE